MTSRTRAVALTIALTGVLAACGSSGGDGADATTTTAASGATSTSTTTTPINETTVPVPSSTSTTLTSEGRDTETSELDTLPDGDHYGYMAGHEMGQVEGQDVEVILWDEVEFFTGDAAVAAAHEDGAIPADQDFIDNDYYIRNKNQTIRHLAVVPDASVTSLNGGSPDPVPSSVSEVWQQEFLFKINVGNVRDITTISSIDAVFLP